MTLKLRFIVAFSLLLGDTGSCCAGATENAPDDPLSAWLQLRSNLNALTVESNGYEGAGAKGVNVVGCGGVSALAVNLAAVVNGRRWWRGGVKQINLLEASR